MALKVSQMLVKVLIKVQKTAQNVNKSKSTDKRGHLLKSMNLSYTFNTYLDSLSKCIKLKLFLIRDMICLSVL